MKKFWMVFAGGNGSPTKQHETYEIALAEAGRLAAKHSTSTFVLEAKTLVTPKAEYSVTELE